MKRLLPLLNGTNRIDDILDQLRAFGEQRVRDLLDQLNEAGILESGLETSKILVGSERDRYRNQEAFFSHFTLPDEAGIPSSWEENIPLSGLQYQEILKQAHVAVFGLGLFGSALVRALALAGVGQITGVDDGVVSDSEIHAGAWYNAEQVGLTRSEVVKDLLDSANPFVKFTPASSSYSIDSLVTLLNEITFAVLCTDHFNPEQFENFNQAALQTKTEWTSYRTFGFELNIGPTVLPFETPCYKCFDLRYKGNLTDYEEYLLIEQYLTNNELSSGSLNLTPGIDLVCLEIIKALTLFLEPATYGHLFSLNLLSMKSNLHPILKLPRCPHCGPAARGRPTIQVWQTRDLDKG